jgi:hypothetical protein
VVGVWKENLELVVFSSRKIEKHARLIEEGKVVAQTIHYTVERK